MTIQRRFMYISRLAVAATAFAVFSPMAAHAQYSSPIHDVDNAARQPVHFDVTIPVNSNDSFGGIFLPQNVPAGKRLVIEEVTGNISLPSGQRLIDANLITVTGGKGGIAHHIRFDPPVPGGPGSSGDYTMTTVSGRFYADPGTSVQILIVRNDVAGSWSGHLTISGYLVNLP
jgi:hypothetical protein